LLSFDYISFGSRHFLEQLTFATKSLHRQVGLFTHLDKFSVAVTVRHEGELAEERQAVLAWFVEFQLIRLPYVTVVRPVAHWNAGKRSSEVLLFQTLNNKQLRIGNGMILNVRLGELRKT
jgi:hypothetical protein